MLGSHWITSGDYKTKKAKLKNHILCARPAVLARCILIRLPPEIEVCKFAGDHNRLGVVRAFTLPGMLQQHMLLFVAKAFQDRRASIFDLFAEMYMQCLQ